MTDIFSSAAKFPLHLRGATCICLLQIWDAIRRVRKGNHRRTVAGG
jgi:hypothetical protein